ncbi:MAG: Carboxymuconolactone decarboxylase family protein [Methanosaeta sp. PtaU1.Bin112]|nr:MAG: Carboxymuconolactone decarboxylase family protein [Methanosaeta sp. PtaU1.Bin112]
MDENTKELIAIGASLAAHCQPCLKFHIDKARKLGICDDEIDKAIAVGRMIQKGAMSATDKFAEYVLIGLESKSSQCCDNSAGNCCR